MFLFLLQIDKNILKPPKPIFDSWIMANIAHMLLYHSLMRPLLFAMDPEKAHHLSTQLLSFSANFPGGKSLLSSLFQPKPVPVQVAGLSFTNPVGLAAGFDKNATMMYEMALLGFGFIEIGTVTPKPQSGNPSPRMFRLPQDEAIINRMGFNNDGVEAVAERLKNRPRHIIVGSNIGKNKDTPASKAVDDYLIGFNALAPLTDYVTVNVSSPNTPGLRDLLAIEPLKELLETLTEANKVWQKPLFLKLSPDMANEDIMEVTQLCASLKLAGIIATNTTIGRAGLRTPQTSIDKIGAGGLSGKPVMHRSTEVVEIIRRELAGEQLAIIASGGIHAPSDALQKLEAGADLLQLYTGLVYEGPGLVKQIVNKLA